MNQLFKSGLLGIATVFFTHGGNAQSLGKVPPPNGWHLLAPQSGHLGINLDSAYMFLKENKIKSSSVIVGVIDSGLDTTHEDMASVLWTNKGEIPGNGIDDDKNGYVDDFHGWNFIGGKNGTHVTKDSYEANRVYYKYKSKWGNKTVEVATLSPEDKFEYEMWKEAKALVVKKEDDGNEQSDKGQPSAEQMKMAFENLKEGNKTFIKEFGKEEFSADDIKDFTPKEASSMMFKTMFTGFAQMNDASDMTNTELLEGIQQEIEMMEAKSKPQDAPKAYRAEVVKDNYADFNDKYYGNNLVFEGKSALHGTHVAGIIGADRVNNIGANGVADNVKLMTIRAVPDGDEHDKDIALSIRYAVDNGAKVVNMSFGKGFSPEKKWVDDAVKYAESKGVLLIHAAGNDGNNLDKNNNYPCEKFQDNTRPGNWITVGASTAAKNRPVAPFSNYSKNEVDVFAPGHNIYAPVPTGNAYQNLQGTSMASPVVAGVAALLLEYFPHLSPAQVKSIILASSTKIDYEFESSQLGKATLAEFCRSGGILNAYEAVKLAYTYRPIFKAPATTKPKTKRKKKNK